MLRDELIGELLTVLERAEVKMMEWGFLDVSHTAPEIVALFGDHLTLGQPFRALAGSGGEFLLVDDLAAAGLLFRLSFGPPARYRSRFAETCRLLVRLRQRFKPDDWASAPELVSDIRFHLGPRRFPVRDIDASKAWQVLKEVSWRGELQCGVLNALYAGRGGLSGLAAFQLRAAERILRNYRSTDKSTGTVITAGTGGGKTKAFYIPALMGIVADIDADSSPTAKVLSVYPRNVLLADQFAEATSLAMSVSSAMAKVLPRPVRVGALIGDVPLNANFEGDRRNVYQLPRWPRPRGVAGHRVPHMRDPASGRALVWMDEDRWRGQTCLRLEHDTSQVAVPDGIVVLTRAELLDRPPDILLTSIEMLNKELSSEFGRKVLGFGARQCPLKLVLLDEIHTYEGLTGAQVPWILRRLAYWTRGNKQGSGLHVVGLSATLQDAPSHLATLSGVPEGGILEIAPDPTLDELTTEGQEYNVVVKSHPGGGAGVLATSIQTVMLGGRVLTPASHRRSRTGDIDAAYFFGRKLFGFTDNLDVVNRWFPDFWNAEQTRRLAALRQSTGDDSRWLEGQEWRLSEQLKHDLRTPLRVARTSSQDPGVDADADIVLATSALEVGFDDDDVGMVIQHKAPRSAASFLQRKGRAGRRKGMRPWSIVVLSEHGRDRWAFRDSERLFAPTLNRLSLPVFNPYVLRIQATWFLVDWIARQVGHGVPSLYLARPKYFEPDATRVVRELIERADRRLQLTRDLSNWLRFGQSGVRVADPDSLANDLLWKPPRAVLREVVPVLWNHLEGASSTHVGRERLLPRYLPERTWDVLDAQDVQLRMPGGAESQWMDVARALRECVPGRVSRRYSVEVNAPSRWLEWSIALVGAVPPTSVGLYEVAPDAQVNDDLPGVVIHQPTKLVLGNVPQSVKKSSNAEWDWTCTILSDGESGYLTLHTGPAARALFAKGSTWLHRERSRARVYRYASSFRYETLLDRDKSLRGVVALARPADSTDERTPAIGFVRSVDGIELGVREDVLFQTPQLETGLIATLRPLRLRYLASRSEVLTARTSVFGIGLLVTSAIGMIVTTALRNDLSLQEAWQRIPNKAAAAAKVLRAILSGEVEDDDGPTQTQQRSAKEVVALWENPVIADEMSRLIACLWEAADDLWRPWLRAILLETIRAAVEAAVQSVLPEVPETDFSVEVVDNGTAASVWILEADAGGVGVIDRLLAECSADQTLFDTALEASLTSCRAERVADNLSRSIREALRRGSDVEAAFDDVRKSDSYAELYEARSNLLTALEASGCDADREAVTAIVGKALMPGSNRSTDHWLRYLSRGREVTVERLGIALDPRVWAYWTVSVPRRRRYLSATLQAIDGQSPTDTQITTAAVRLTLDPCRDSCPECLGTFGELRGLVPSRRLARQWLNQVAPDPVIVVEAGETWLQRVEDALRSVARLRIRFENGDRDRVVASLMGLLARRFDRGYALSGFRISALTRRDRAWELLVRIDDMEVN
jgi:hypothetical protein